ncbi:hypothetical protein ACTXT7_005297 [Hymenolepis weldensis]
MRKIRASRERRINSLGGTQNLAMEGTRKARPPRQPQTTSAIQQRSETAGSALSVNVNTTETPRASVSVQTPSTQTRLS